ncbi:DUF4386 domain-containing protein [Deinococcus hopiensis]|uniref:DUF4386 domain-containing protein n=1 Tax=Deinococcus hopiensis KR-140 TaxID=695939 RepID=A0A1W1UAU1_9DEIO|nr:DUF4386 domain-containing protein [Deinococcus hopiensis]SMB78205.1 protein of unknown function [Deinococcus hopiensis KR-140]
MKSEKFNVSMVGTLFVVASLAAVVGVVLYAPMLKDPAVYFAVPEHAPRVKFGVLAELILASAAVGTAVLLFPYLKRQHEGLALGYVALRLLEAALIIMGVLSVLTLLSVNVSVAEVPGERQVVNQLLLAAHEWTFLLGPNLLLGLNTLLCGVLLYTSCLVPRWLSALGMVGAVLVIISALLTLFGMLVPLSLGAVVLALPVALYEMLLAFWLMVRGFSPSASPGEGEPARGLAM